MPVLDGPGQGIPLVNATTGTSRLIGDTRYPVVTSAQWLPGGREIIAALRTTGSATAQVWRVDAETGAAAVITRDLFNYTHVRVASDSGALVAMAGLGESTLWTANADRLSEPQQITTGAADGEGAAGVSWAADGSIMYTSRARNNIDLWTLDPKTGIRRQLTSDPADDTQPSVSPDGRLIAFVSSRQGGSRIWVMHLDGTDPRPVSSGPTSSFPFWRPDSSAILFLPAVHSVLQVNADGRGERSLQGQWSTWAGESAAVFTPRAISPQGLVSGFARTDRPGRLHLAFGPFDGSAPLKRLDLTVTRALDPLEWAPDGKAIDLPNGSDAGNLWRYPIDGRPGYRLTTFTGTAVTRSFDWSADGRLVLSRGENKTDLVLFRRTGGR